MNTNTENRQAIDVNEATTTNANANVTFGTVAVKASKNFRFGGVAANAGIFANAA